MDGVSTCNPSMAPAKTTCGAASFAAASSGDLTTLSHSRPWMPLGGSPWAPSPGLTVDVKTFRSHAGPNGVCRVDRWGRGALFGHALSIMKFALQCLYGLMFAGYHCHMGASAVMCVHGKSTKSQHSFLKNPSKGLLSMARPMWRMGCACVPPRRMCIV